MSAALRRSFTSLAVPNYRRYFAGQIVSLSGNWMQMVAEMWLILALTGSGVAVGVTSALQFLPMLLFGAWGGLLADRFPKRSLLIVTQTLMALPALALWAVTSAGVVAPWMVFALVFARGAINAVDNPTRQSFVIEMVGADRVVNAVSLNSVLIHSARILGPGERRDPDRAPSGSALLPGQRALVRRDDRRAAGHGAARAPAARPTPPAAAGAIRAGPALRAADARAGDPAGDDGRGRDPGLQLPGHPAAAGAVQLRRRRLDLHRARGRDGGRLGRSARWPRGRGGASGPACWSPPRSASGPSALIAAAAPTLPLEAIALVPLGAASVTFAAGINSSLQLAADPAMRGRVMALYSVVFLGSTPIGGPIAGWLSQAIDPRAALVLAGAAGLIAAIGARAAFARVERPRSAPRRRAAPRGAIPLG